MKAFFLLPCLSILCLAWLADESDPPKAVSDTNQFAWQAPTASAECSRDFMEKDLSATYTVARIDAVIPLTIRSGSSDAAFTILGTRLDQVSGVYVLDQDEWWKCPFNKSASSTRATVLVPSKYLTSPHFLLFSAAPELQYAQTVLVYSLAPAQAVVDSTWKVSVVPEDIGAGGWIQVMGSHFVPGVRAVLGRANVAGIILNTQVESDSYLQADIPTYVPGNDLFITVLSADGRTRSAPTAVLSSYPTKEDDLSQQASGPSPTVLNEEGMRLMEKKDYEAASAKFVEAARLGPNSSSTNASLAGNGGALFANNAGFAYYKIAKYEEAIFWLSKAIEIDPKRAVAYVNLGDVYAKLKRNVEARQAYTKFLEFVPDSRSAADIRKKLNALGGTP